MKDRYQFVRPLFVTLVAIAAIGIVAMCAGCATAVKPQTPDQSLYAAYGTYTVVAETVADLTTQGTITVAQARDMQDRLHSVRSRLDQVKAIIDAGGDLTEDRLAQIKALKTLLIEIQHELESRYGRD